MARRSVLLLLLFLLAFSKSVRAGDGGECAACVVLVGLIEIRSLSKSQTPKQVIHDLCTDILPLGSHFVAKTCDKLLDVFEPLISSDFESGVSPDDTCKQTLFMCDDFQQCTAYNDWPPKSAPSSSLMAAPHDASLPLFVSLLNSEKWSGLGAEAEAEAEAETEATLFEGVLRSRKQGVHSLPVADHLPLFDGDGDRFSKFPTLRGYDWRGRDCNDLMGDVYPGRAVDNVGPLLDHNCNGIKGLDSTSSPPSSYEDKFCRDYPPRSVVMIGDSASAHFSIPPTWLTAATLDNTTFENFIRPLEDELDWPACSWSTGHSSVDACPETKYPLKSIYQRMVERNRCGCHFYENLSVNGGASTNMNGNDQILHAMHNRTHNGQPVDVPATVFFVLMGNDVCSHHTTTSTDTTPSRFEMEVLKSMEYLDAILPPESDVIFGPVVDGRILYDEMHSRIHPVGVTYEDLYEYLICLDLTPCWGWMNNNETVRNETWKIAQSLTGVYEKIISERKFANFEMHFANINMQEIVDHWVAAGGEAKDLIEATDGFHPSSTAQAIIAEKIWEYMEKHAPRALGVANPHNGDIADIFGGQDGCIVD